MKFIGLDVHNTRTSVSVSERGKEILNCEVKTTREELRRLIGTIQPPRHIVVEEGQLADWCKRNLEDLARRFVVSDPRRNRLVSEAEDKDDPVDAYRLGLLFWLGQVREVYHGDAEFQKFKETVNWYWQSSTDLTRAKNRLRHQLTRRGVHPGSEVYRRKGYERWREEYEKVWGEVALVDRCFSQVEFFRQQKADALKYLRQKQRRYQVKLRVLRTLPGFGLVVAASFLAYIGDPWRFPNKRKLWKYCGLALRKPKSNGKRRGRFKRSREYCRPLRNVLGIAVQGVFNSQQDNDLLLYALRRKEQGAKDAHVRRDLARKLAVTAWTMLKTQQPYQSQRAC